MGKFFKEAKYKYAGPFKGFAIRAIGKANTDKTPASFKRSLALADKHQLRSLIQHRDKQVVKGVLTKDSVEYDRVNRIISIVKSNMMK